MTDMTQDATPLDLLASSRLPQLRSLLMETQSERMMRNISFSLFQRMRHSVELLSCVNGVISHNSALSALPDVMLAGITDLTPLRGRMIVAVEGDLIGAVVDGMCGATSGDTFVRTQLSAMEMRIGKQMIELVVAALSEVLSNLTPLRLKVDQYETAASLIAIADGQDWMIATTGIFASDLGIGSIKLILPYASLEPLEARLNFQGGLIGAHAADARWAGLLNKLTDVTPIELRLELVRARISIAAFQSMRLGQLLPCQLLTDAIAVAGGVDLFYADFGQMDGYVCCRPKIARIRDEKLPAQPDAANGAASDNLPGLLDQAFVSPRNPRTLPGARVVERVPILLTVELGRTNVPVQELRQLRHGQVIMLDQTVEESLDIFANGHHVASGEVVAIAPDQYGIRVTRLVRNIRSIAA
jgi:flagellar motor switch protein FliM